MRLATGSIQAIRPSTRLPRLSKPIIRYSFRCEVLTADKGYDDAKLIAGLWDDYRVKPVIDIQNMWRDGEDTRLLKDNIVYNYRGTVYCHCPKTNKRLKMPFGGFEKGRETLKYRCPPRHYGRECKGMAQCGLTAGVRIPLKKDRQVFTPIARSSYKWATFYNQRTEVYVSLIMVAGLLSVVLILRRYMDR